MVLFIVQNNVLARRALHERMRSMFFSLSHILWKWNILFYNSNTCTKTIGCSCFNHCRNGSWYHSRYFQSSNVMLIKWKTNNSVGTFLKSNSKIAERGKMDTPNTQIHDGEHTNTWPLTHKYMTANTQIHDR